MPTKPNMGVGLSDPRRSQPRTLRGLVVGAAVMAAALALCVPAAAQVPAPAPRPEPMGPPVEADAPASEPAAETPAEQVGPPIPIPHPQRVIPPTIANFQEAAIAIGLIEDPGDGSLFDNVTSPNYLAKAAYDRLEAGEVRAATQVAAASSDTAASAMIEWLIAIGDVPEAGAERMAEAAATVPDWPGRALMQIRYEQAVRRDEPSPEDAVAELGDTTPVLEPSILLLARSYMALGQDADAEALIRGVWRNEDFSEEAETAFLTEFGDFITVDDKRYRMSRLLYTGQNDAALRVADLLSSDMQALAAAWVAVNNGRSDASSLLAAVPTTLQSDPGYQYARLRQLVRTYHYTDAANLLLDAPTDPDVLIDPEAWADSGSTSDARSPIVTPISPIASSMDIRRKTGTQFRKSSSSQAGSRYGSSMTRPAPLPISRRWRQARRCLSANRARITGLDAATTRLARMLKPRRNFRPLPPITPPSTGSWRCSSRRDGAAARPRSDDRRRHARGLPRQ